MRFWGAIFILFTSTELNAESLPELTTQPCRPTVACTADLIPPGQMEIETGYLYQNLPLGYQSSVPTLFKLTVLEGLQMQVGGNTVVTDTTTGSDYTYFDDVTVGPKYQFLRQSGCVPSMAVSGMVSVPTPKRAGFNWHHDGLIYHLSETYKWLHGDFNYGANFWRGNAGLTQTFAALTVIATFSDQWDLAVEGSTFSDAAPVAPANNQLIAALGFTPLSWLTFDAAILHAYYHGFTTTGFTAGMTFIPGRLWLP